MSHDGDEDHGALHGDDEVNDVDGGGALGNGNIHDNDHVCLHT